MLQRLYRPAMVVALLTFFVAGFAAYLTLSSFSISSGPTEDELWPGTREWAESRLDDMTLEEKVSQLFSARAYSHYTSVDDPRSEERRVGKECQYQRAP